MPYDGDMTQNGGGMLHENDAVMSDLDASLFSALNMDGSQLMASNSSTSFIDSLTNGMPDELNLPFSELDSFVSGGNGSNEYCLSQLTSSLEFDIGSMHTSVPANNGIQQASMAVNRGGNCVSPSGKSNQELRRLLAGSQGSQGSTAESDQSALELRSDLLSDAGSKGERGDLNSTLLQLLIRQQIQQNEQRRILERLQSAILSNDKNAAQAAATLAEAESAKLDSTRNSSSSPVIVPVTNSSANASQVRTGHIQALLETSPPPPNGTATLRQYEHLSQNELRQSLISTDYQQQMKRGVNVNAAASQPVTRNGAQTQMRVALANPPSAGSYVNVAAPRTGFTGNSFQIVTTPQPLMQTQASIKTELASTSSSLASRRRSGTSTAATSPTSRQALSAFASTMASEGDDCDLGNEDGEDDGDSFSQPTVSGTAGQTAWPSGTGGTTRRSAHNVIEKRYRSSINDRIGELKHLVAADQPKIQKSGVLRKTVDYIYHLKSQNEALRNENAALKHALIKASANGSRFDPATLLAATVAKDECLGMDSESMFIQADSPNALECFAENQSGGNRVHGSPPTRNDSLLNAPSPPDAMMASADCDSPPTRQTRSPPRPATRGAHAKPIAAKPAVQSAQAGAAQKLNSVLSGRQLACAALDRTKLLLCVAMVTFVAVNPLEMMAQRVSLGAPTGAVEQFTAASLGHVHNHAEFGDFSEPHAGGRILSSVPVQIRDAGIGDSNRLGSSWIWRFGAIWLINLLVVLALVRRVLTREDAAASEKECETYNFETDTAIAFSKLKAQGDAEYASRRYDEAHSSYRQALRVADCENAGSESVLLSYLAAVFVNPLRSTEKLSVPLADVCTVYSRLMLMKMTKCGAETEQETSDSGLRLALSALGKLDRARASRPGENGGVNDTVADTYLSIACVTLSCSNEAWSPVNRFLLHRIATLAFDCAGSVKSSDSEVMRSEELASFLFDDEATLQTIVNNASTGSRSLSDSLVGAFLRARLDSCLVAIRDSDSASARTKLDELRAMCKGDCESDCAFWLAATSLFTEFDCNWQDVTQEGIEKMNRTCMRNRLKEQTGLLEALKRLDSLLQRMAEENEGMQRAAITNGRVTSQRTVSIAHLVYRAVRAFVVLSTSNQPRAESFKKLRLYLNNLSNTLRSVQRSANSCDSDLNSFELNVARCAARWSLTLRLLLCALHREHVSSGASTSTNVRTKTNSKWISECQADLDMFAELSALCSGGEQQTDATLEFDRYESCLHELANSNPLQSVFVRMRVLAA